MTLEEATDEMKRRGITMKVGGCGCCGSPWVAIAIDGKRVYGEDEYGEDNSDFDTITPEVSV